MRALGPLVLIAVAFGAAGYCFQRPTVASGDVIAADLVAQNRANGWRAMRCQREIRIGVHGATFACELDLADGDSAYVAVTLDHDGHYTLRPVRETAPAHHHVPASGDPWGQ